MLATGQEAKVARASNGRVYLRGLPEAPPDPHDTVIKLELDGPSRGMPMGPL